jgi:hypothetical protein
MGQIREKLRRFGFIPVRCRNVCGTFVERLFLYFGTLLISNQSMNNDLHIRKHMEWSMHS